MMTTQKTRSISLRLPEGLYNKVVRLATKNHLNPHAYAVKLLWSATKWDSKNESPETHQNEQDSPLVS